MVRIPHLLVGTFLLRLASARVSRSQAARRVSIPLNHGDDELAEFGTALKVKKRNGSPESGAGFCRKRAVVVENAGAPITLASGSQQVPPSTTFACNPEDADCLPTNTIATATSTSYIDVTSTIYVTAAPAITSQYTTAQPSVSMALVSKPSLATTTLTFGDHSRFPLHQFLQSQMIQPLLHPPEATVRRDTAGSVSPMIS